MCDFQINPNKHKSRSTRQYFQKKKNHDLNHNPYKDADTRLIIKTIFISQHTFPTKIQYHDQTTSKALALKLTAHCVIWQNLNAALQH